MLRTLLLSVAAGTLAISATSAETIRWARAGDSLTLDPHAQNEGPTHALAHQIYDGLPQRDMAGAIIPSLATDWAALDDNPNIWRFNLRQGVSFHDGAAFDSADVVFSINRAMADGSDMKELLSSVKEVRAVDAYTVDIETNGANPLPIFLPCHRVIASDGTLAGFGGGVEIKRQLLDHERAGAGLFAQACG